MINLCLVVIATQFSETKKREMERMRQERARYTSTSTITSSTNNSEPSTCYAEIVKYIAHLWRRGKRRLIKKLRNYKYEYIIFSFPHHFFFCHSIQRGKICLICSKQIVTLFCNNLVYYCAVFRRFLSFFLKR